VLETCAELYEAEEKEKAYRQYVAEALRVITENTAKASLEGGYVMQRCTVYDERIVENRTAQEIVEDVSKRAGITIKRR